VVLARKKEEEEDIVRTNKGGVTNLNVGTINFLYPTFCPVAPGTLLGVKADPPRQWLVGRSSSCKSNIATDKWTTILTIM